jgi:hypothetical protein
MDTIRPSKLWVALTADIVHSRAIKDLRRMRDERLQAASKRHRKEKLIIAPYAVTAWDEFQTLVSDIEHIPRVVLDLRLSFRPFELRIGIGIGAITEAPSPKEAVNLTSGGPAFERARNSLQDLSRKGQKYRPLTAFSSPDPLLDLAVNLVYGLHDTLLQRITEQQWKTIVAQAESNDLTMAAKSMGLSLSTVSRNLKRGFYWQLADTAGQLRQLLAQWHFS